MIRGRLYVPSAEGSMPQVPGHSLVSWMKPFRFQVLSHHLLASCHIAQACFHIKLPPRQVLHGCGELDGKGSAGKLLLLSSY